MQNLNIKTNRTKIMPFTITIDGPAAAGKGTLSKMMSKELSLPHLDTGLLFRVTGRRVMDGQDPLVAAGSIKASDLDRKDLRSAEVGQAASEVSAIPEVRKILTDFQKTFARQPGGAILDGRCIGIEICPEAQVKIFVTASDEVRATRRWKELVVTNPDLTVEDVLGDLQTRDTRDASRATAPMKAAPGALLLDTSYLTINEALDMALCEVSRKYQPYAA
jgi:cytidylate kinase